MQIILNDNEFINQIRGRIALLKILFLIAFLIIAIRLFYISGLGLDVVQHYQSHSAIHHKSRPEIFDRNGVKLAVNLSTASLYTNPIKIQNKDELASKLHNIFHDLSYESLYKKLSSENSFVWLKRHLTPKEQSSINKLGNPYLKFKEDQKRIYPHANFFAHLLGYVDIDGRGLSGLELYIDQNKIDKDLTLSVDSRVQNILHEELKETMSHYQAIGAAGVILDAHNSNIIAIVSLPDFDPHHLNNLKNSEIFNRATLGLYEFGSIVKPFTVAAALDANVIDINTEYNVTRPLKVGHYTIKDFHTHPTPTLNIEGILRRSSNIGMAKISLELGEELHKSYFDDFGLFRPLTIEIPEKANPITPKVWRNTTGITLSYGYGSSCTLLHIAQGMASLVNGGRFYNASTIFNNLDNGRQVIREETSNNIRQLIRSVVQRGTGRRAHAKGYDVGGKTGSAEKSINGVYVKSINVSSFVAAFPISDPQYVVAIMIDEPKPIESQFVTGGIVAAPTMKRIINKIAPILNVPPQ